MILSVWRYSHLVLAVSSFAFIIIASITGTILSLEPVREQMSHASIDLDEITISQLLPRLEEHYLEVFSIRKDQNDALTISALDSNGEMGDFYLNPSTGEPISPIADQSEIFKFSTSLHRSLFLKGFGRLLIGLSCFCLFLITTTGIVLIIKRQQGIKHFFNKIIQDNFYQYYHVYLGRQAIIPILILTFTGTFLSLQRFNIIPESDFQSAMFDEDLLKESPKLELSQFPIFTQTTLDEIREVQFPFSPDVYDPFVLMLQDRELSINQITGEIITESTYPFLQLFSELMLTLHTGRGNGIWAITLGTSSIAILFFIFSGYKLTFKRTTIKLKNHFKPSEAEWIVLVGSETGSTTTFSMQVHEGLLKMGERSYITEMNQYQSFPKMNQLIILTSTYGQGEAPAGARNFLKKLADIPPANEFKYAIIGFGSLAYADYCKYAYDVSDALSKLSNSEKTLPLHTINNRSWESFKQWVRSYNSATQTELIIPDQNPDSTYKKKEVEDFRVIRKTTAADNPDHTFTMILQRTKNKKITSGDLLAVYPPGEHFERLYSISATAKGQILLSIKKHDRGICSPYLDQLKPGETLHGRVDKNPEFYFPKKSSKVIMIGTGTGIAPFLGMLTHNRQKTETHLYWGARTEASYEIYKPYVEGSLLNEELTCFKPAYSRTGNKTYVQNLLEQDADLIAETLTKKGTIMLCGSIAMQQGVLDVLKLIVHTNKLKPLSYYQNHNQIKIDCY